MVRMIRTRDFLIFLVILICATVTGGIFFASYGYGDNNSVPLETAIFLTPHEAIDAVPYYDPTQENEEAFIDKVRRTYVPHEDAEDSQEVVIRAPENTVLPISSTTTPTTPVETYGDTGF